MELEYGKKDENRAASQGNTPDFSRTPESGTTLTRNQRSILNMQQTLGNSAVLNHVQRDPPATASPATPPRPLSLFPRQAGATTSPSSLLAPLSYSQMNAILNPAGSTSTPAVPGTASPTSSDEHAVEGTITLRFNGRRRLAGTGGTPDGSSLSTETETTGHVAPGVDVTHTGSDEGHQFGVSIESTLSGRGAPELSGEGTIQLDPTGTRVTSIEIRGGAQWTRTYLDNMLRIQPFVRLLVQAESEGGSVAASAPVSLSPTATATAGVNARLRIGGTTIRGSASIAVEIPSHEFTTTLSAEVSQRVFGPLSVSARGERRDTFGAGDPSARTTGTLGVTLGDPEGTNFHLGAGVESSGGRVGGTLGADLTVHF